MTLTVSAARVALADRLHVSAAMARFGGKSPGEWLVANQTGGDGTLPQWDVTPQPQASDVIDLVAACAPTHCIDGWTSAARALSALTAGDLHGARHLAYYAQLRAAMSILANVGIGIFDGINVVIDETGQVYSLDVKPNGDSPTKRGVGTHSAVWDALELWATDPKQAAVFLDLVRIKGTSLRELVRRIWPGYAPDAVAGNLITTWGIDLARGRQDKGYRNTSSYNPHALNPLTCSVNDTQGFVSSVWQMCRPSGPGNFDPLDRHLLRRVLQSQQDLFEPDNSDYISGAIGQNYKDLPATIQGIATREFLNIASSDDIPSVLAHAESTAVPAHPTEMIARAFMLLRVSTAFTHSNFVDAGTDLDSGSLRPWLDQIGSARGFWPANDMVLELSDLWADVEIQLADLDSLGDQVPLAPDNWPEKFIKKLTVVTEAERIGLWSLSA